MAKKILFDSNKNATGVLLESALIPYIISARKEVILSAGAFQSPQLLMVSGIGPAAQLQKHSIPVLADRPGVGQNMQDHIFFGPSYRVNVPTLTRIATDPVYLAAQIAVWALNHTGYVLGRFLCLSTRFRIKFRDYWVLLEALLHWFGHFDDSKMVLYMTYSLTLSLLQATREQRR